ncbi:MAG: hypothetical protein HOH16_06140 [Planctomycetaceae bacterium]|jgi:hypothetical protein|nr:hypothetical protein [Planctomycetaceae bacterium]
MTNDIAIDADRLSLQVLKREKRIIGQAAFEKGYRSTGDYVRHLIQLGIELEDSTLAEKYKSVRAHRYSEALALCCIGSIVTWQSLLGNVDLRRSRTPRKPEIEQAI